MAPSTPDSKRYVEHVMGMPISLALRGAHTDDASARSAWAAVMAELREVDRVFSTFRVDSVISRLGRGEIGPVDCPPEVTEVLGLAEWAEHDSGGAFRVRRPGPDGESVLDPNGVVKGWAAERAAEHLRALPDTGFCLSAGGDLVCRTLDPDGAPWRVGVEDPRSPSKIIAVIPIRSGAVATSGTAHRGEHIVDGRTGRPPADVASVTVVADTLTWADIDATAAYAHGRDAATWLRTRPDRTGLVVWRDGRTTVVA
ncbi:FAD:protein FMN transferase [Actinokineospora auranticolor]|uniref:FAD:protein FMN transferase n=1 Tax=Actinokineospora auranticolor TaxID=155976 RepID=A0A2S6H0U1_9PSEU|nr:FAD:protein FMN transferase [Actinokineospora auranticolor]PPK71084.1 thiamine biosynthesis lipoprotein [Actinokineospora auranticolor]